MADKHSQRRRLRLLSHGRPPTIRKPAPSLTSKATRTLIRTFHQLQKKRARAVNEGDAQTIAEVDTQIESNGGLRSYQLASIHGQSSERGGDSSIVLMNWLGDAGLNAQGLVDEKGAMQKYSLLEVGALSVANACSRSPLFQVTRIDLHSQDPQIQEQDFMERPLPRSNTERFDVISLSLVLNYVPDAAGRGDMLRRTTEFLRFHPGGRKRELGNRPFPSLFLVLPAPCVTNSRYLTESHLSQIMSALGFVQLHRKLTAKLIYYLWHWTGPAKSPERSFSKIEVNPGKMRNNFCVTLH